MTLLSRCIILPCFLLTAIGHADETNPLIAAIKAVGREGAGNVQAARAWQELVRKGPDALIDILSSIDDATTPTAANWLRAAVDAIAEKAQTAGKTLPAAQLEAFVRDRRKSGPARRLAYEWLVRLDAAAPARLLPNMLDDPGAELRRDAVAVLLQDSEKLLEKGDKAGGAASYQKALAAARDVDQVERIAERLNKIGTKVDLTAHWGFVTRWMVVGPFNNVSGVGFGTAFPPEKGVDLKATYQSKDGKEIRWQEHVTKLPLGLVDFNKVAGPLHGATYFGFAALSSKDERPVEVRVGSNNAVRIYLNGKEIYFREEYHHGMQMDQHVGRGQVKAGRNEILIKVCQNEQEDSWAQQWSFQLRICDALGAVVPVAVLNEGGK